MRNVNKCCDFQGQNPDEAPEGDFMSEAKDWAGELISAQTGMGKILVSGKQRQLLFNLRMIFRFAWCSFSQFLPWSFTSLIRPGRKLIKQDLYHFILTP